MGRGGFLWVWFRGYRSRTRSTTGYFLATLQVAGYGRPGRSQRLLTLSGTRRIGGRRRDGDVAGGRSNMETECRRGGRRSGERRDVDIAPYLGTRRYGAKLMNIEHPAL